MRDLNVTYPVAIDSDYRIWQAFNNEYWPANYFIDGKGRIRYHHFGEGEYGEVRACHPGTSRRTIRSYWLGRRAQFAYPPMESRRRPAGCAISRNLCRLSSSPAFRIARTTGSRLTKDLQPTGDSFFESMGIGRIVERRRRKRRASGSARQNCIPFHSRDLHMVLGPAKNGKPVRFKVTLDGAAPGDDHGVDSAPDGAGEVREPRLYQLIRQKGQVGRPNF